jgi:hypothetical protein
LGAKDAGDSPEAGQRVHGVRAVRAGEKEALMFDPRSVAPDALGIAWGGSQTESLATVTGTPVRVTASGVVIAAPVGGGSKEIALYFEEDRGLSVIHVSLFVSRDFWDGDWEYEEMDTVEAEYLRRFTETERFFTYLLGPPDFRGDAQTEGTETAILGAPGQFACWNLPEAWIQLQFSHEDKELPFCVDLYLVPPRSS